MVLDEISISWVVELKKMVTDEIPICWVCSMISVYFMLLPNSTCVLHIIMKVCRVVFI